MLLASGANVNAVTKNRDGGPVDTGGMTPLHIAVRFRYKTVAELLLANKADVNTKNNNGETPLHCAYRHKDVAEVLRQHGGHE